MTPNSLSDPDLLPAADAIVACVRQVIDTVLAPQLTGQSERSAIASIRPTLRYVEHLIRDQGQMLLDEQIRLMPLLAAVADWLEGQPEGAAAAAAIRADIGQVRDPAIYPSLAIMARTVARLRQHVCAALARLHDRADDDAPGGHLHEQVRAYLAWQLEAEGRLIAPAFKGQGPRR